MRLQQERRFEEGDIWRVLCSADPERALRGLRADAAMGQWHAEAWRCLLWTAAEKNDQTLQAELADLLLGMPDAPLEENLPSASTWLQRRRECLMATGLDNEPRFYKVWDRFAAITYEIDDDNKYDDNRNMLSTTRDILSDTLNKPGGILAWTLLDALSATTPTPESTLGPTPTPRFDRAIRGRGESGLLARVYLIRALAYLDQTDPIWTAQNLVPCLAWDHADAATLWHARATDFVGSARLFNALKPAMLEAFERQTTLSAREFEGLVAQMLTVALWRQHPEAAQYNLTFSEIKRALSLGPSCVRRTASWQLWSLMGGREDMIADKGERWRTVIGPLFGRCCPRRALSRAVRRRAVRSKRSGAGQCVVCLAKVMSFMLEPWPQDPK
jgi:hypothetical protein